MNYLYTCLVVLSISTTISAEQKWSWTDSEKRPVTKLETRAQRRADDKDDSKAAVSGRNANSRGTEGKSFGVIDKIKCKIGFECTQNRQHGSPFQVYPPPGSYPHPVPLPSSSSYPGPAPYPPHPSLPHRPPPIAAYPNHKPTPVQPIGIPNGYVEPYPPVNKIPIKKPYPPIKPSKTEVHHHIHTHLHKGGDPYNKVNKLGKNGFDDIHSANFAPTIIGSGYKPTSSLATSHKPLSGGFGNHHKPLGGSFGTSHRPISGGFGNHHKPLGGNFGTSHRPISGGITSPSYRPDSPLYKETCLCVPSYQCSPRDYVARTDFNDHALDIINPRVVGTDVLSSSARNAKPKKENKSSRQKRRTPLTGSFERNSAGYPPGHQGCARNDVCCRIPGPITPHYDQTCGISGSSAIHGRIATTDYREGDTSFGQYPWQVVILRADHHNYDTFVCGGTLISDRHVLTAAHCIDDYKINDLKLRFGEWDVNGEKEFYPHEERYIAVMTIHPEYYAGNLHNDLAVITIQGSLDFHRSPHILPICLPDEYSNFDHQQCTVTGWGKDAFGHQGKYQHVLKELKVPVVSRHECEYALQSTRLGPGYKLPRGFMCAGGEPGKDSCEGDGGGPLICPTGRNTYQLAGIVSWGVGCGKPGVPGVYVDIPYYTQWIKSVTRY